MTHDLSLVQTLEEMSLNAMPALATMHVGGWAVRFAAGVTGRANSATAIRPNAAPVAVVAPLVEAAAKKRGIVPRVRLTPLAPAGGAEWLKAAGWHAADETLTQTAALPVLEPAQGVALEPISDEAWRAAYARAAGRFGPAEQDVLGRVHRAIVPPVAFARVVENGRMVAHGYAVAERGWVSLHEIGVQAHARRRGLARRVVAALLAWGAEHGAERVWLQVAADNAPAIALYRTLGFTSAYAYVYWLR